MNSSERNPSALGQLLDAAENSSPADAVEAVTNELAGALGATSVSFLIADLSGRGLVRLACAGADCDKHDSHETVPLSIGPPTSAELASESGPAERALRTQTLQIIPPDGGVVGTPSGSWTVLAPVTERGEVLGLLEMQLPGEPPPEVIREIARTAHALAFVVIANRRHTDVYELGQRSAVFTLPAEIQRQLLPAAYTCEAGTFTLAAWLEPAADIGGDSFDYSLGRDVLHLSLTDAMGHGIEAALTATLCVGSLRNTRRRGASLLEQVNDANESLMRHGHGDGADKAFVTGLISHLDLRSGVLSFVNAGHVPPYLARDGKVQALNLQPSYPLGLFADPDYEVSVFQIEPGDRLVFVTDGMLERNAASIDLAGKIGETRHLHPREATRSLADEVLRCAGALLADDATLLILDWHGQSGSDSDDRATFAGADTA